MTWVPWEAQVGTSQTLKLEWTSNPLEQEVLFLMFQIGEITIYLQLHVQQRAPFEVLIGRPFDVLTESVIKNHADGSQEVTITDPNTGNKCTMGTHIRSTRQRLRTDNPEFKPKLVPEHAGSSNNPVKEEQGNF
jgi:hypothetical protein